MKRLSSKVEIEMWVPWSIEFLFEINRPEWKESTAVVEWQVKVYVNTCCSGNQMQKKELETKQHAWFWLRRFVECICHLFWNRRLTKLPLRSQPIYSRKWSFWERINVISTLLAWNFECICIGCGRCHYINRTRHIIKRVIHIDFQLDNANANAHGLYDSF